MKGHVRYDYMKNCTRNRMVCLDFSSTEQKIIWRQIGFPSLRSERARYYMTELHKFNKNINVTIEGTCSIWVYAELHEESNGAFRFFIYRAENNLKTNWISDTQIRTYAQRYINYYIDGIAKFQHKYKFNDWRDMLYMIVWRIARVIEWYI